MKPNKQELYKHIEKLKEEYKDIVPKWGILGFVIFIRTYARWIENLNRHETFAEMTARVLKGAIKIGVPYDKEELSKMFKYMFEMKALPAGRDMFQMGTDLPNRGFGDSLMNCAFVAMDEIEKFVSIFDMLLKGTGVGFSVEKKYISQLPVIKKVNKAEQYSMLHLLPIEEWAQFKETGILIESSDKKAVNYLCADSRYGWCELIRQLLHCYFETGQNLFFDVSLIRKKGERIKNFGGKSSGSEPLVKAFFLIKEILDNAVGRQLNSVEVTSLCCILAQLVVSGNVRRSALLSMADFDDIPFITMKRRDLQYVPDYLAMVNISVNVSDINKLPQEFWDSYEKAGESIGLINIDNCQTFGRTGINSQKDKMEFYPQYFQVDKYNEEDGIEYLKKLKVDPKVKGCNACTESTLPDFDVCALAEAILSNIENYTEFVEILFLLYKLKKHSLQLKFENLKAQEIINSESRIGIGITGIFDSLDKLKWLSSAYKELREFDKQYSLKYNLPIASKLTVIKPSGTLSKMAGVSCGVHPHYFRYGYMTIRMASNDELWKICEKNGYKVENAKYQTDEINFTEDELTKVVYFPIKNSENSLIAEDVDSIKHLNYVKLLNEQWADQSVSATIYYTKENLPIIKQWLIDNWSEHMKTISFLQYAEHGFLQAPYIPATKEEIEIELTKVKPIVTLYDIIDKEDSVIEVKECEGGGFCPIR